MPQCCFNNDAGPILKKALRQRFVFPGRYLLCMAITRENKYLQLDSGENCWKLLTEVMRLESALFFIACWLEVGLTDVPLARQ